jgi:tetratricopeptide (TPR) repeat protein
LRHLSQPDERKLSKISFPRYKKAVPWICLFLLSFIQTIASGEATESGILSANDQWEFDAKSLTAYELVLSLRVKEARALIPEPATAQEHYAMALAEALELLITEDGEKYTEYEEHFTQRLDRKTKTNIPDDLFLQAEIRMQWTFVYLKFGHEFDAALNLRQAYLTVQEIKKRFPHFQAVKKTSGLLEVLLGSVPQKYNWVLSLLNLQGSIKNGFNELESVGKSENPLAFEAKVIHALINGFLQQQPGLGLTEIKDLLAERPHNKLALFVGSALAIKNSQSEVALSMLDSLASQTQGLPVYYADNLRGEIYLHKGEYLNSISSYRSFINNYRGQNGIKDAYYKIGLCYWLNGNVNDAQAAFKQARSFGKEASEADKYAARSLAETELPHIQLTRARYAMDGGYYGKATEILAALQQSDLPTKRDEVEYNYRKARLEHKLDNVDSAKIHYEKTILLNGDEPWYYAPNSCLQLGYIFMDQGDDTQARNYFNKALSYGKHEYKNSIDSKAKSAIAHIKRK